MPRTKISEPRSLSNRMVRGFRRCACAARKLRTTVFPEPDGPIRVKLPRSALWKLKKYGVLAVVSNTEIAGPQWLSEGSPVGKPCRDARPEKALVEISAVRAA